jgi:hypothetical protein
MTKQTKVFPFLAFKVLNLNDNLFCFAHHHHTSTTQQQESQEIQES